MKMKPSYIRHVLYFLCLIVLLQKYCLASADLTIMLLILDSDSAIVHQATKEIDHSGVQVLYFSSSQIKVDQGILDEIIKRPGDKIVLFDTMDSDIVRFLKDVFLNQSFDKGFKYYALRETSDKSLADLGVIFDSTLMKYYAWPSKKNITNMLSKIIHDNLDTSLSFEPPEIFHNHGIYHPEAQRIFSSFEDFYNWHKSRSGIRTFGPWIGITLYSNYIMKNQSNVIDHLIKRLEQEGYCVLPAFGPEETILQRFFMDENSFPRVDLIIAFTMKFSSALKPEIAQLLNKIGVPIINAINLYGNTVEAWQKSPQGLDAFEVAYAVSNPEISGVIEPSVLGGKVELEQEGRKIYCHSPVEENVEVLIQRVKKWIGLKTVPNIEKRLAVLYYNHNPGKQDIGASYLNLFSSLTNLLKALRQRGYDVGPADLESSALKQAITKFGRNVGTWAPGELEEIVRSKDVVLIPVKEYEKWYQELPLDFRKRVESQWGKPEESKIMFYEGKFVIPIVYFGKVAILPEPSRGISDDPMKLYHSPTLYPHHQYIASYLWLKHGFKAHAMIHFGTHASHEWLPGKQIGLSHSCDPEVLITDIPNLYPYIMDNIGEGIQAKRRGRGVIVDHLIPPLKRSGLYSDFSRLYELIQRIKRGISEGDPTVEYELETLDSQIKNLGIHRELRIQKVTPEDLDSIEDYLLEIRSSLLPYGLHTLGSSPPADAINDMVSFILDTNPKEDPQKIKEKLNASGQKELEAILEGLEGRYIAPGEGNDPIRNPNALPTGRNFYGFNPQKIPTPEAFEAGKKAADEIIKRHLEENKELPKKVAVVLWAVETMRNGGVNESTVLALLGIEPVWDRTGKIVGIRPIPGEVLKRPRVDVLINPSGLYRDLFPEKLILLDRAVKMALIQKDVENLVRENYEALKSSLLSKGLEKQRAEQLAKIRIFGEAPGTYGTGVSDITGLSGLWESDQEISGIYTMRVGNSFGEDIWGDEGKELFHLNLSMVDTVLHSFSSNLFGAIDNDDVFDYVGGLSLAVRNATGKAPKAMITFHRNNKELKVNQLSKVLGQELKSRYLNPKWIEGMKKEGYSGARTIAKFMEYFWGFQVTTPDDIYQEQWNELYSTYVEDRYNMNLKKFFSESNPWAYQSILARMLEAIRKGYWNASTDVRQRLALGYVESVLDKGIACCDHTCNNPFLNQMVINLISVPGLTDPQKIDAFLQELKKTLKKDLATQIKDAKRLQNKLKTSKGRSLAPSQDNSPKEEIEGYKFEKVQEVADENISSSGIEWLLTGLVFLILSVFLLGYHLSETRLNSKMHSIKCLVIF